MKIEAFSKTYGERCVLKLPALTLREGAITAVIGANGSGKSTLAKVLAGIDSSDQKVRPLRTASIGYVPQKSFAFRMSTEKNILLNGGDRARAQELMAVLRLDGLETQRAKKLSGGETAKMTLARLMMRQYELVILDEPTAAMDMESTLAAEALMRTYCEESGCALLLITHSLQQARRLAEDVLFLHKGELIEQGSIAQVLSAPRREETRRFLDFYGI